MAYWSERGQYNKESYHLKQADRYTNGQITTGDKKNMVGKCHITVFSMKDFHVCNLRQNWRSSLRYQKFVLVKIIVN